MFESKLPLPPRPSSDVFNYIFHYGRRAYPWHRVIYRVDGGDETLSLAELEAKSRRFADSLVREYGIKPNNTISILARDRVSSMISSFKNQVNQEQIEYPIAFFGAMAAGATIALIPIQSGMSVEDVADRLHQSGTRLLITDSSTLGLAECASELAGCIPIVSMDRCADVPVCLEDLIARGEPSATHFSMACPEDAEQHNAFINRTSGSTGNMKSVLTTSAHYIGTMEATKHTVPENTDPDNDVWLSPLSLGFFVNAKLHMSLNVLLGIPVILINAPLDETNTAIIKKHRITFLFITPPTAAKIAKSKVSSDDVSSIKWLLSAGASIHANLKAALREKFVDVDLTLEWGTSETMLIAIQTDNASRRPGSSGTLVNGMQARVICTETGKDLGENQKGEILVRNRLARYAGYKNNEAANKDFDSEGWFHTGDFGYLDAECNVYIIDRLKELLRVGDGYGSRISATQLESVVFEHPAVKSVIVVGVYSESTHTEHPTAFIILTPEYNSKADSMLAEEIERFTCQKLTGLKRITGGFHFLPQYPTTGFKIDRRKLKGMAKLNSVKIESPLPFVASTVVQYA